MGLLAVVAPGLAAVDACASCSLPCLCKICTTTLAQSLRRHGTTWHEHMLHFCTRRIIKFDPHEAPSRIGRSRTFSAFLGKVFPPLSLPLLHFGLLRHRYGIQAMPVPRKSKRKKTWIVSIRPPNLKRNDTVHADIKLFHAQVLTLVANFVFAIA